jgi:hydroxymethylbilane synthase
MISCDKSPLSVAARSSRLSRAQVVEVLQEIHAVFPYVDFVPVWVTTTGDRDLTTSLRLLDKTDFFTREIDQMLLQKKCRIAIHSAKDLPEPLPEGLKIVAVTKGVDSADSLVFRSGENIQDLPSTARVGVSCMRREETVKKILPHAQCSDIRGAIDHRLAQLEEGIFDAIVVAEAALIRLGLTHLNRFRLEGLAAPLQGRLAVVARKDDREMEELFRCMDVRVS